jgi:hypothetical protein
MDLALATLDAGADRAGPLLVLSGVPATTVEVLARSERPLTLLTESTAEMAGATTAAALFRPRSVSVGMAKDEPSDNDDQRYREALWVGPRISTWRARARRVDASLYPGGRVAIIGAGPLADLQLRLRPASLGLSADAADCRRIARALRYETVAWWRLSGLASAGWALLRSGADVLRRPDLADRLEAAYRLSLVRPGTPDRSSIGVWVGRKPAVQ